MRLSVETAESEIIIGRIDATGFDQEEALAEEKSQKQIARDMMAMVGRINRNYYPK